MSWAVTLFALGAGVGGLAVAILVIVTRWVATRTRAEETESPRKTIQRDSPYTTVIYDHHDGYGIAAAEVDGGVKLQAFDSDDEVYEKVWVAGEEVPGVVETLAGYSVDNRGQWGEADA